MDCNFSTWIRIMYLLFACGFSSSLRFALVFMPTENKWPKINIVWHMTWPMEIKGHSEEKKFKLITWIVWNGRLFHLDNTLIPYYLIAISESQRFFLLNYVCRVLCYLMHFNLPAPLTFCVLTSTNQMLCSPIKPSHF